MLQLQKILVPRDFSSSSVKAMEYALDIATRTGAEVHLLFADVLHGDISTIVSGRGTANEFLKKRLLEGTQETQNSTDIKFISAVVRDVAAGPAIVAYAEDNDIDLIVMGTHGRRGVRRLLLGSTAEEVVRTAPCPVFTIRQPESPVAGLEGVSSILVPIDFSKHAKTALHHAKELASLYHSRLDLIHVIEEKMHPTFYNTGVMSVYDLVPDIEEKTIEELKTFFRETEGPIGDVAFHVRHGHAAHEIAEYARDADTDMLVMSTHGMTGLEHALLGSVAEKVVRWSPVPVFTVKTFGKILASEQKRLATEVETAE